MIRWGYYIRRGLPELKEIRIQRIRCKHCGRTTNILPAFLLAQKSYSVYTSKHLLNLVLNNRHNWKELFDLPLDISTAYRWLRYFRKQIIKSLPTIRKTLIELIHDIPFIDETEGKPLGFTSDHTLFNRFLKISNALLTEAVHLVGEKSHQKRDLFCFLNFFLYQQTGKSLLIV